MDDAMNKHQSLVRDVRGISTRGEYAERYSETNNFDEPVDSETDQQDFSMFFRCFPYHGQSTMVLTNNPGIVTNMDDGEESPIQAEARGDTNLIAGISRNYILSYLNGTGNFPKFLEELSKYSTGKQFEAAGNRQAYFQSAEVSDWKDEVQDKTAKEAIDWMQDNPEEGGSLNEGLFSDVYYSVAYKLATKESSDLKRAERSLAEDLLPTEIQTVDPKLIICSGAVAWESFQHHYKGDLTAVGDKSPVDSVSDAEGAVFTGLIEGKHRHVAVTKHPQQISVNPREEIAKKLASEGVI